MSHAPSHGAAEEFSEHGLTRPLSGFGLQAVVAIALCFSTYQLFVAAFHPFSSLVTRSLHVGFLLLLTFLIYPATKRGARHGGIAWWEWALAVTAFAQAPEQARPAGLAEDPLGPVGGRVDAERLLVRDRHASAGHRHEDAAAPFPAHAAMADVHLLLLGRRREANRAAETAAGQGWVARRHHAPFAFSSPGST